MVGSAKLPTIPTVERFVSSGGQEGGLVDLGRIAFDRLLIARLERHGEAQGRARARRPAGGCTWPA
jgi:hypothetical protein